MNSVSSSAFSVNRRRLTLMWSVVLVLFSAAAASRTITLEEEDSPMLFFDLPSLSMTLDVEKSENALIPFQNQLKDSMEEHIENFFNNKLLSSEVGVPTFVDVDLESQMMWKELWVGPKETTEEVGDHTYTRTDFVKKYELKAIFNCKMKLQIDPIVNLLNEEESLYISQSLINIFFLEAFQSENYWDLVHGFLTTPVLRGIINTDIEVLDVGFVHPYDDNGNLIFESDDDFEGRGIDFAAGKRRSILATVGTVFAVVLLLAVGAIWYYLCVVMKGNSRFVWKKKKKGRTRSKDDASRKGSSTTGSTNSEDSGDDSDDSDDETLGGWASSISANLDAWASSITSIPLRDVEHKRRKKKGGKVVQRPYFRPCQEHSSDLGFITEADNESWCSSVKSNRSGRSAKSAKSRASRYSRSRSRKAEDPPGILESNVILEEEDEAEDEEQAQKVSLLTQRQLIKLMPSEDEVEDYRNNRLEI